MKGKLLALILLAGGSLLAGPRVFVGINVGGYGPGGYYPGYYAPPPPPPAVAYMPPCPGPGYSWVAGYWRPAGPRYQWRAGFWARTPYAGAYWVAPRYHERRYYRGYWGRRY